MGREYRRRRKYALSPEQLRLYAENQGLVFAACRRYRPGANGAELDELIHVARLALLNAAEGFDAERGFRFGTYAFRAIACAFRGLHKRERKHRERRMPLTPQSLRAIPAGGPSPEDVAHHRMQMERLEALLVQLDAREQRIIRGRKFGVPPDTLEMIGRELGLSKERVRQIEVIALGRLRELAGKKQ